MIKGWRCDPMWVMYRRTEMKVREMERLRRTQEEWLRANFEYVVEREVVSPVPVMVN